jgi:hypothetical protein
MAGDARLGFPDRGGPAQQNIEMIYFRHQNAYPAPKGRGAVQFLIEHFTFLGFEVQNWMLIVIGLIAVFILFVWKTRDRT